MSLGGSGGGLNLQFSKRRCSCCLKKRPKKGGSNNACTRWQCAVCIAAAIRLKQKELSA